MPSTHIRVAVNGYGVIGKRVADSVALQDDMTLAGVADISADWRPRMATRKGFGLFGATAEHVSAMVLSALEITAKPQGHCGKKSEVYDINSMTRCEHSSTAMLLEYRSVTKPPQNHPAHSQIFTGLHNLLY